MSAQSDRKQVLIVEDNKDMGRIYEDMFRGEGQYLIEIQDDARVAFKRLEAKEYDLIILDIIMEPMAGDIFYACVKQDTRLQKIPVIVVSVLHPDDLEYMKKENRIEFLRKPIKKEQLFDKIEKILT